MASILTDEERKLLTRATEDLERKTKQAEQFRRMYDMSKESAKKNIDSEFQVRPEPKIIQGAYDRLGVTLEPRDKGAKGPMAQALKLVGRIATTTDATAEEVELVRHFEAAKEAAAAKLTEIMNKYSAEIEGCGAVPGSKIALKLMSVIGKVHEFTVSVDDNLAEVKAKVNNRTGIPLEGINIFVHPRKVVLDGLQVVFATQIKGATDLIDESAIHIMPKAERHAVWDKINGTGGYGLWGDSDTAASLGLHDGAEGLLWSMPVGPSMKGRSPLCTADELRTQDAIAMAWYKQDVKALQRQLKEQASAERATKTVGAPVSADEAVGAAGCCVLI